MVAMRVTQDFGQLKIACGIGSNGRSGVDAGSGAAAGANSSGTASGGGSAGGSIRGKGSRGPRPRLFHKGQCQADGCSADLSGLPRYHQRNHICMPHKIADSFMRLGMRVRFCQRCGQAHPLAEFDGLKKSCRRQLEAHNNRRRKAAPAQGPAEAAAAMAEPAAAAVAAVGTLHLGGPLAAQGAPAAAAASGAAAIARGGAPPAERAQRDLLDAELAAGADWAAASLDASPEASVGSALLSEPEPGSWLLEDAGSGGGGSIPCGPLPMPAWDEAGQLPLLQPLAAASAALGAPGALATACGGAADERVCCSTACGVCGACRDGATSGPAGTLASGAACTAAGNLASAAAAAAGGAGCLGGAPLAADCPARWAAGPPGAVPHGPSMVSSTAVAAAHAAAAAAASEAEAAAAAAAAPAGVGASGATSALEQLRQQNAALYQLYVSQQLVAAQTLLATAGMVLSRQLPLVQQPGTSSVCTH